MIPALLLLFALFEPASAPAPKSVTAQGMTVTWQQVDGGWAITMTAPTQGWVAIGFNESEQLTGTYLIMGAVENGQAKVVEHRTLAPGDYRPITELGGRVSVSQVQGSENATGTQLGFWIPEQAADRLHKQLKPGSKWHLLLAYSAEDDFAHHSRMRTSIPIEL